MSFSGTLPIELQRIIFLWALRKEGTNPVHLLLVAKDVYAELLAHLYKTRITHPSRKYRATPSTHSQLTRNIFIECYGYSLADMNHIFDTLHHCRNTQRLALLGPTFLYGLSCMFCLTAVTHLSISAENLRHILLITTNLGNASRPPGFTHLLKQLEDPRQNAMAFLSRITHLEIIGHTAYLLALRIQHFTSLKQLCVSKQFSGQEINDVARAYPNIEAITLLDTVEITPAEGHLVQEGSKPNSKEEALIAVQGVKEMEEEFDRMGLSVTARKKAVVIHRSDLLAAWEEGANGGEDTWKLADRVVQECLLKA
ncbi:hypothetical protein BDN72DRAFT_964140 [Pluteus cervinus]|uniref:Uncharacterized protein n=1 Tax=Pluteus cervinus TaxID=181527 RepID=A0ACD3ABP5_9AGAR|nr:hypothetical protein BDN72DRAFT_964140 [Pluteus cervinus]